MSSSACGMTSVALLNALTGQRYLPYAPAPYRPLLSDSQVAANMVALGASHQAQPAGLAVARHGADRDADILSLFVAPRFRRRGLGTALLDQLEHELVERGIAAAHLVYPLELPGILAFERLLHNHGWCLEGPRLFQFLVHLEVMSSSWATGLVLPPDCEFAPWSSLSAEERDAIVRREDAYAWIPARLMPLRYEAGHEPSTSLILRSRGRLAGWLLTHVVHSALLDYTNLYVDPEVNRSGSSYLAIALLAEGFRRHEALQGRVLGRFVVHEEHRRFVRFVDRRMRPFMRRRTTLRRLSKQL